MMKQEFEKLIEATISNADWEVIHTVYQFHPAITDVSGKKQVATLYKTCGMVVFHDMFLRAQRVALLESQKADLKAKTSKIQEEINALARN